MTSDNRLKILNRSDIERQQEKQERNSRRVRVLRLVFPILAVIVLAVVLSWNTLTRESIEPLLKDENTSKITKNELLKPRYEGTDDKGRPFILTAERANQKNSDDNIVVLNHPSGQMNLSQTEIVGVNADIGEFNQKMETLVLRQDVKLGHSDGYTLDTEVLDINMTQGTIKGTAPVIMQGQQGTLSAQGGLSGNQALQTLRFFGPIKMIVKDGAAL